MTDIPSPAPSRLSLRQADGSIRPRWAVLLFVALAAAAVGGEVLLGGLLAGRFLRPLQLGSPVSLALVSVRAAVVAGVTWLACRAVGWRMGDAYLRDARWLARAAVGVGVGSLAFCLAVLGPLAFGYERFSRSGDGGGALAGSFLFTALTCAAIALSEELLVRGFALRQLERSVGRWGAAVRTAAAFGLLHVLNPHADWLAVVNIMLVGLWLAVLVQRTGSLWMAVGAHLGWNLVQGFVWGEPVSGFLTRASLLVRAPPGDALWTGGAFGPEASLPTAVVLGVLVIGAAWGWKRPDVTSRGGSEAAPS